MYPRLLLVLELPVAAPVLVALLALLVFPVRLAPEPVDRQALAAALRPQPPAGQPLQPQAGQPLAEVEAVSDPTLALVDLYLGPIKSPPS